MVALRTGFPDIVDDLRLRAGTDPVLAEALDDYQEACKRLKDKQLRSEHRAEWVRIRDELSEEIYRLFKISSR